jgi:hypothetical protein
MHSSASVTCRALAMLTCAVAIPLVAIFGGPLGHLSHWLWTVGKIESSQNTAQACGEPPKCEFMTPSDRVGDPWSSPSPSPPGPTTNSASPASEVVGGSSVGGQMLTYGAPGTSGTSSVGDPPRPRVDSRPGPEEAILASYETAAGSRSRPLFPDEAEQIQQQLRRLGAVHYVLESWGSEGNYRFVCRIAIEGNPQYTRYFEATGRDGLSVMKRVLQQVEASCQLR